MDATLVPPLKLKADFTRSVMIFLSKDGVFQFAKSGTRKFSCLLKSTAYLPCASVDTLQDANKLRIAVCALSYDGTLYRYPFEGTLAGLELAGRNLEILYRHHKSGAVGWPEGWPLKA